MFFCLTFVAPKIGILRKLLSIVVLLLVCCGVSLRAVAQQPRRIKVSEINVSSIKSLEERVFLLHSILDKGYYCRKNAELPNTIDVYIPGDAPDELSDFDFFYDNLASNRLNEFHYLDKNRRGELFVRWRRELDNEVYQTLYEDFTKGLRDGENNSCDNALPFCASQSYNFAAGVNAGDLGSNIDPYYCPGSPPGQDNCLYTTPNPAFYYMRIQTAGDLDIYMYSNPSVDIDFDCWGPFSDINLACSQLACSNLVDCSYSAASTEHCFINNAQVGEYYILLITNYSNQTCQINFSNTTTGAGAASTDCSIVTECDNNGPYCVGETIQLTINSVLGATYYWTHPATGFTSTLQNPTIPNCTMADGGVYMCTVNVGGQSTFSTTEVVVYPNPVANFTATTVCQGQTTQFTSTSTTNPTGSGGVYQITSYTWDFGDGQTGTGPNPSHTYAQGGDYQVTLTVSTGNGLCTDQITMAVHVIPPLNVQITVDGNTEICDGESVTLHAEFDSVDFHYVAPGDILCTDNTILRPDLFANSGKTAKGVVFYVDNSGSHGWAVSLTQSENIQWSSESTLIGTAKALWSDAIRDLNGKTNTQNIRAVSTQTTYPAAWFPDFNNGWYLPSSGQLNTLYGELVVVNASLNRVGGTLITDTAGVNAANGNVYLWSSTEKNAARAYAMEVQDGQTGSLAKNASTSGKQFVVRAIIDF